MNHYDTLDVPRDASADDIKQAWRRKASAEHPDRGGNAEAMAQINRAYETLGDEQRRARYDASGDDQDEKPVEADARDMLLQLFNAAIAKSDGNWLREVSEMLGSHMSQVCMSQAQCESKLDRLVKRTGKVKIKAGENLVQMLIDQQVANLRSQLKAMARAIVINKTASAMLTAYEMDEEGDNKQSLEQHLLAGGASSFYSQAATGGWR